MKRLLIALVCTLGLSLSSCAGVMKDISNSLDVTKQGIEFVQTALGVKCTDNAPDVCKELKRGVEVANTLLKAAKQALVMAQTAKDPLPWRQKAIALATQAAQEMMLLQELIDRIKRGGAV